MGNIWYRNNEYFSIMGAVKVILFPLQNGDMWAPNMWDINYFIWVLIVGTIYYGSFMFHELLVSL